MEKGGTLAPFVASSSFDVVHRQGTAPLAQARQSPTSTMAFASSGTVRAFSPATLIRLSPTM